MSAELERTMSEVVATLAALTDEVTAIGDEMPTKREIFAALLLAGTAKNAHSSQGRESDVRLAVAYADRLIAEFAKPIDAKGDD
jgi:hypothetical protein